MVAFPSDNVVLRRFLWLGGILVLLAIFFPVALKILFAAEDELTVSAGPGLSSCSAFLADQVAGGNCVANYQVVVGNTGSNRQEQVQFRLTGVPPVFRANYNVSTIVASARRTPRPAVEISVGENPTVIDIGNLHPNRLVEIRLAVLGRDAAERLDGIEMEMDFDGSVIEADPHLTVVARFVRNVFSVIGL